MLLNSIYGNYGYGNYGYGPYSTNTGCTTCGGTMYAPTSQSACGCNQGTCGCNSCNSCGGNYGSNLGSAAYCFIGEWVNIVVTLTILQSILGLVCNWNCGSGSC